jgi:hypothetical protein
MGMSPLSPEEEAFVKRFEGYGAASMEMNMAAAIIRRLEGRVGALEEALRDTRTAIVTAPDDVITDTLWMGPAMTVVDCIDAALNSTEGSGGDHG